VADDADRADASANPYDEAFEAVIISMDAQFSSQRARVVGDLVFLIPDQHFIPVQRRLHRHGELVVDYSAGRRVSWRGIELLGCHVDAPRLLIVLAYSPKG